MQRTRTLSLVCLTAVLGLCICGLAEATMAWRWALAAVALVVLLDRLQASPAALAYVCWVPLLALGALAVGSARVGPERQVFRRGWDVDGQLRVLLCREGCRLDLIDARSGELLVADAYAAYDVGFAPAGKELDLIESGEAGLALEVLGGGRVARLAYWSDGPVEEIEQDGVWRQVGTGALLWDLRRKCLLPADALVSPDGEWLVTEERDGQLIARRTDQPSVPVISIGHGPLARAAFSAKHELTLIETMRETPGSLVVGCRTFDLQRREWVAALTLSQFDWRLYYRRGDDDDGTNSLADGRIAFKVGSPEDSDHTTVAVFHPGGGTVSQIHGVEGLIDAVRGNELRMSDGHWLDVDRGTARALRSEPAPAQPWQPHWHFYGELWGVVGLALSLAWLLARGRGDGWGPMSALVALAALQLGAIFVAQLDSEWTYWSHANQRACQGLVQAYGLIAVALAGRGRRLTAGMLWIIPAFALASWGGLLT